MRRNYLIVDEEKYYTGAVFIINHLGKQVEASFVYYDTERARYMYTINGCRYISPESIFKNNFVAVTNKIDNKVSEPTIRTKRDRDINGLPLGWVWYIFLMLISVIFKDVIFLWVMISIVFFNWRAKKIKEEGTYIEW